MKKIQKKKKNIYKLMKFIRPSRTKPLQLVKENF